MLDKLPNRLKLLIGMTAVVLMSGCADGGAGRRP